MNLLLFSEADRRPDNTVVITGRRLQHLKEVLSAQQGDSLRVGEIDGGMGLGRIVALDDQAATLQVSLTESPPEKLPITLVLALPRPKMLRRILRTIAETGVTDLHLINSYRVEKSYWQTPVLEADTVRDYLLQGLEQARDTGLPTVTLHRRFKPFVEDTLPSLLKNRHALLAQPGDYPLAPTDGDIDTLLVIGPEGGFIPYEVDKLEDAGCTAVSMGKRILRVETAVTALLGRLISR
ncbi:MAG: 16S rRNA (uracil(1498)-N(3))-methyltransferase [Halieaceae bacterium]